MARMKSMSTIETEIAKTEADLAKAKKRYDTLAEKLLKLQEQKQQYEAKQIIEAYKRSGRSFQEVLTFFGE